MLLTTGFYVGGFGETDGPPGTMFLAKALYLLGFNPIIVTDDYCQGFFMTEHIQTVYVNNDMGEADYAAMLDQYAPTLLISIERCGRNSQGDDANLRGVSIADHNARVDWLFELGARRGLPAVGVGDGGNDAPILKAAGIGVAMGNADEATRRCADYVTAHVDDDGLAKALRHFGLAGNGE